MKNKISVLMIAAEAHPLAKVGGLADVIGALPRALAELGNDVTIALPHYKAIKAKKIRVEKIAGVHEVEIDVDGSKLAGTVRATKLDGGVRVLLIGNDRLFGRDGIYTEPATGKEYPDNPQRFIFFTKAVLEVLRTLQASGPVPDVIHCHDYQSGFVPAWLKTFPDRYDFLADVATVFTIHNLGYQGVYPASVGRLAGFGPEAIAPMGPIEYYGKVNMMKAGIVFGDRITTVSPTYAREIQTAEYGCGLEGVLKSRSADLLGIMNGADYSVWDPAIDRLIPANYGRSDTRGKTECKRNLIRALALKAAEDRPLVGMISRLVGQKGFDITTEAIDALMGLGINMAILGMGEKKYHDALAACAKRFPGRVSVTLGFDEQLAHLIEAGCDMFLMPSKYEPCGLNQLYSMRYGTVPIVRRTGGLADSVRDFAESDSSTGFAFGDYDARSLVAAVERAVKVFAQKDQWAALMARSMAEDFSWGRAAKAYESLYCEVLGRKRVVSAS